MNQTIAIFFDEPGILGYPFNYTVYYDSYRLFSEFCADRGVKLVIVRDDSYRGHMRFKSGWHFVNNVLVEHPEEIKADLVYVKGLNFKFVPTPGDIMLDDPIFDALTSSKLQTYELVGEDMIPTFSISNENWEQVLVTIPSSKVILKPDIGAGGEGIMVLEKEGLDFTALNLKKPYTVSPFVDSSAGIQGITTTRHDLRILVFGDTPRLAFIRTPKNGGYLSNSALGGSIDVVDFSLIPESAIEIAKKVIEKSNKFGPKVYSIDFMFENGKPWVVEMNTRPGFPHPVDEGEEFSNLFFGYLLTCMQQAISLNA